MQGIGFLLLARYHAQSGLGIGDLGYHELASLRLASGPCLGLPPAKCEFRSHFICTPYGGLARYFARDLMCY